MTTKADLTPGNWAVLVDAAPAIARAVAASAGAQSQSVAELTAFVQFVSEGADQGGRGNVVDQLVADVRGRLASGVEPVSGDAFTDGLELARRAGAVLAVELEPEEATSVRAWYLAGARQVAGASREGGVLGIGSTQLSTWERETLKAIADALGAALPPDDAQEDAS